MMLLHEFDLEKEALCIENAVRKTLQDGFRTGDIMEEGKTLCNTIEITDKVIERL